MKQKTKATKPGKFTPGGYALRIGRSITGVGLFAMEPIEKGKCIVEYTGRRVSKKEEYESNSKYLFEISKTKTIDGRSKTNKARYINHSCVPNCEIEIRLERVYVFSKRKIRAGEELTYDYDTNYFNEYIKPVGCKCIKHAPHLHTKAKTKVKSR